MIRCSILLVTLAFLISLTGPVLAQEISGSLEAVLTNAEGVAVQGADAVVTSPEMQGERSVRSDPNGRIRFPVLPVGVYRIEIRHPDYRTAVAEGIRVSLGTMVSLGRIRMEPQTDQPEVVVVTAEPSLIDATSTVVGGNLAAEEFVDLPLGRSYRDIVTLLPHVQTSFLGDQINVAGGTGYENKYYIDGTDVTDMIVGKASTDLPYNFIREIRIRSGGYQAEYAGSLGGVVDVITLSGTNEFEARAFGFFVNDQLMGEPRLGYDDPATGTLEMYDAGFSVGGPIAKDSLWYLFAYNPAYTSEELVIPGGTTGRNEVTTHRVAAKLNWRVNDANSLVFAFQADPTKGDGVGSIPFWIGTPGELDNLDGILRETSSGGFNAMVDGEHRPTDRVLLESRLSFVLRNQEDLPSTEAGYEPLFADMMSGIWEGGRAQRTDNQIRTLGAGLDVSWLGDRHTIKTGFHYSQQTFDVDDRIDLIFYFLDENDDPVYDYLVVDTRGTLKNRMPSTYLQDSWQATSNLLLNLGLRWDGQYILGSDGEVAQRFTDQWQPRLGFTYQLERGPGGQFSGSCGRYYQAVSLVSSSLVFMEDGSYVETIYDHDPREDPSGGVTFADISSITEEKDLEGQHFDEFTLGWQKMIRPRTRVSVRGIYRELKNGLEDAEAPLGSMSFVWGNPGYGELADYPKLSRIYRALELGVEQAPTEKFSYVASYVLSQNRGNYSGLFPQDLATDGTPNMNPSTDFLEMTVNGYGLLPNDRTHTVKMVGTYRPTRRTRVGLSAAWMSGTPLNEWGPVAGYPHHHVFIQRRGTAGRTPSIWDLNLRLAYLLPWSGATGAESKVVLDWLHVFGRREPVNYDQVHYFARDAEGGFILPNPNYGAALAYQPPMAVRFGVELAF